jgi:GntR family transcriptional regulator
MGDGTPARYEEIADYLRGVIAEAQPGDRLPSDAELCERFGVSRMTARHAVQVLLNERLLYRERGRGTFASARPIPRLLGSPLSFSESTRQRGKVPSSQIVFAGAARPNEDDIKALAIEADDLVGVLERIRYADGVPMAIERAVITPSCSGVVNAAGEGSLHAALERLGRIPSRAQADVTARQATKLEHQQLRLAADDVVLCERRIIFDQNGLPLEHTETRYAAERYVFEVTMFRNDQSKTAST